MPEILKVFTCVVCGKRFDSKPALGGHMRWHKGADYLHTSVDLPKALWTEFSALCDKHGTTTCQVIKALLEATIAGEKQGIVTIPSQNPTVIQVNHVVLGAPRGRYSHFEARSMLERLRDPLTQKWPAPCEFQGSWWDSDRSIGCLERKERVSVRECWTCYLERLKRVDGVV